MKYRLFKPEENVLFNSLQSTSSKSTSLWVNYEYELGQEFDLKELIKSQNSE
jgi:hypothetical protein